MITITNSGLEGGADGDGRQSLSDLLALAADWLWEQDAEFRFTHLQGRNIEAEDEAAIEAFLGKCRWDIGLHTVDGSWEAHRAQLQRREPFRDVLLYRALPDGSRRYAAISGIPILDPQGEFIGYRGIGRDLTAQQIRQDEQRRLQAAIDASPDPIFVADAAAARLLYANQAACRATGYSHDELLQLAPEVPAGITRAELERLYADVIASGSAGLVTGPTLLSSRGGKRRGWWELHWRAVRSEASWLIVTSSREVSERKLAEEAVQRTAWTFAALSATNEATLRVATPEELYQRVCDAAVEAGKLVGAAVLLPNPQTADVQVIAATGRDKEALRKVRISVDAGMAEGQGLVGIAYRSGEPCVSDDFLNDERTRLWRGSARALGVRAGAAIPLLRQGQPIGVLLLYAGQRRAFDAEIVGLLQRMAANIIFALDSFDREAQRLQAEEALRRGEEKYRTILESIEDAYYEVDLRGNLTFCNSAFCRMVDYSEAELIGTNHRKHMRPEFAARIYEAFNTVYRSGQPISLLDWELIRRDGRALLVEGSVQLTRGAQGAPTGFRGIIRDLTERKQEERLLALEHAVTRRLAEANSTRRCLQAVARVMCESEQWESGGYYSLDPGTGSARLVTGWRRPGTAAGADGAGEAVVVAEVPAGGLVSSVAETGQPLWVPDIAGDPHATWQPPTGRDRWARLFFPVRAEGRTIGVFIFRSRETRAPERRLLETLRVIGDQVGQFLQRKWAEQDLRESEARFRSLTELSSDWYWEQDAEFRFTRLEGRHLVGDASLEGDDWLGRCRWETGLVPDNEDGWRSHRATLLARQPFRDVVLRRTLADGTLRYISVSGEPVLDAHGRLLGYRGVGQDVTDSKHAEERIRYLATHDSLTGLPNRVLFSQLLNQAIPAADRHGHGFAVMFIDLDRFKLINDTLGHEAGDVLLKEVAARLQQALRSSDVIARLGGDEFVILLQEADTRQRAATAARKVLAALAEPVIVLGQECRVTASIGICMYPSQARDEQSLMKNADIAMYLAKEEGKNNFRFYSSEIQGQSFERLALESSLRAALERDELVLHYQAKLDLKTDRITGVEALLRWNHPQLGMMLPNQFIPLAEESGLIVPIGRWVLQTACQQNMAWLGRGLPALIVAVNLSPRQFIDEGLLDDIAQALRSSRMPPQLLELELTEGTVMQNPGRAAKILHAIKDMGIRIAMDDFGVGYSSLAQLKGFPIDTLKVDRSFIHSLPESAQDRAITEAIVAMAKSLSLVVVAEGVETAAQKSFLRQICCDESQGFYFSKPGSAAEITRLLHSHSRMDEA